MTTYDLVIRSILVAALIWMGIQDFRTREVSNVFTVPLLIVGTAVIAFQIARAPYMFVFIFMIALLVTCAALCGWMGGADWKVLVGLLGLWPMAAYASLIGAGFVGFILWVWTRDRNVRFPAVCIFAASSILTFLGELVYLRSVKV